MKKITIKYYSPEGYEGERCECSRAEALDEDGKLLTDFNYMSAGDGCLDRVDGFKEAMELAHKGIEIVDEYIYDDKLL